MRSTPRAGLPSGLVWGKLGTRAHPGHPAIACVFVDDHAAETAAGAARAINADHSATAVARGVWRELSNERSAHTAGRAGHDRHHPPFEVERYSAFTRAPTPRMSWRRPPGAPSSAAGARAPSADTVRGTPRGPRR